MKNGTPLNVSYLPHHFWDIESKCWYFSFMVKRWDAYQLNQTALKILVSLSCAENIPPSFEKNYWSHFLTLKNQWKYWWESFNCIQSSYSASLLDIEKKLFLGQPFSDYHCFSTIFLLPIYSAESYYLSNCTSLYWF